MPPWHGRLASTRRSPWPAAAAARAGSGSRGLANKAKVQQSNAKVRIAPTPRRVALEQLAEDARRVLVAATSPTVLARAVRAATAPVHPPLVAMVARSEGMSDVRRGARRAVRAGARPDPPLRALPRTTGDRRVRKEGAALPGRRRRSPTPPQRWPPRSAPACCATPRSRSSGRSCSRCTWKGLPMKPSDRSKDAEVVASRWAAKGRGGGRRSAAPRRIGRARRLSPEVESAEPRAARVRTSLHGPSKAEAKCRRLRGWWQREAIG